MAPSGQPSDLMEALDLATRRRRLTRRRGGRRRGTSGAVAAAVGVKGGDLGFGSRRSALTTLGYAAGLAALAVAAEKSTGCFSYSLRLTNRLLERLVYVSTESAGGYPLFTPEGEEPKAFLPIWSLPFQSRKQRRNGARNGGHPSNGSSESPSDVAEDEEDLMQTLHGEFAREEEEEEEQRRRRQSSEGNPFLDLSTSDMGMVTTNSAASSGHFSSDDGASAAGSGSNSASASFSGSGGDLPHFFSSTKLLACLDLEDSRELFESARIVRLGPEQPLFLCGDESDGGTYIVVEGSLGVFLHDPETDGKDPASPSSDGRMYAEPFHTNTLQEGESVGDLDIVDGERRSVTCVALGEGAVLVEISRTLFMDFVTKKPRTLQVYLQQAIARLWRVAHFVLNDTLGIPAGQLDRRAAFDLVPSAEMDGGLLDGELLSLLLDGQVGHYVCIPPGVSLYEEGTPADAFYVLLKGKMLVERSHGRQAGTGEGEGSAEGGSLGTGRGCTAEIVSPHCVVGAAAYFSSTARMQSARALELCELVAIGVVELEKLRITSTKAFISLLVTAARSMGPLIRKFISLGLNRVWLHAHDIAFRQGAPSSCIYVTISGRVMLVHEDKNEDKRKDGSGMGGVVGGTRRIGARGRFTTEEVAGRGETIGSVWSLSGGTHNTSAICTRDSELVRMSRGAFQCISTKYPAAAVKLLQGMGQHRAFGPHAGAGQGRAGSSGNVARKSQRKRVATVALIPLPGQASMCDKLASDLKKALSKFGPTLLLSGNKVGMAFPLVAERLSNRFYRSKLTAWMAAQEEDYAFIILQADGEASDWSKICVAQADCVLLVSSASAPHAVSALETKLVWRHVKDVRFQQFRLQSNRVELVLVHGDKTNPANTRHWLRMRPGLERHHHMVANNAKDMERLGRWLAGQAVGLVLSGGGSRGLAHLGVLRALDDAGVPIDVVGGTSQGAFMAALFAQRLTWDRMFASVQEYAAGLGSVRSLLSDITLPVAALFNGTGFTGLVRGCLKHGPTRIEDLWLRFFCVSTNLTKCEPGIHETGSVAHFVRASMTVVGLLPPVYSEGDLLIDGGYLNNIPVDVMRSHMGVETLIVVDVEDKDFASWVGITPYGDGLSGWHVVWEQIKGVLRGGASKRRVRYPRYGEVVNALMFLSHKLRFQDIIKQHRIDLYMRPTGVAQFKLMDYRLADRIVRDAYRYAWTAITEWQVTNAANGSDGPGEDTSSAVMRLRTRSISKIRSHDYVRRLGGGDPAGGTVQRITSSLAKGSKGRRKSCVPGMSQEGHADGHEQGMHRRTMSNDRQ